MMNRRLVFLLAVLLIGSLGMSVVSAQEPVTLNILARGDSWNPNNVYEPMIEEAVGINLEYRMVPASEYTEVRNVTMASGDLPDAIRIAPTDPVYAQYVDAGLLLPLNDLIEAHPAIRDAYPPEVWEANRYSDGNIYHIPRITGVLPVALAYRGDWADALGELALDRARRERMADVAAGHARRFSWDRTTEALLGAYDEARAEFQVREGGRR